MTGAHRPRRATRAALWLPGLVVALGAAAATAHGLYEVALAAAVPAGIAWLYPLITDGLALVAYGATARLTGSAARYAWAVVVIAAGLSGLAQAAFLASGSTLAASPALRFGVGAWPAVAAAVAAHLLYLLTTDHPTQPNPRLDATEVADRPVRGGDRGQRSAGPVQPSSCPTPATGRAERVPASNTSRPRRVQRRRPRPRTLRPPARRKRRGRGRGRPRCGTPPATAPCRPSPRSRPPPTCRAAPPPPSSNRCAADPCRCI